MDYTAITYTVRDDIAVLTLNRPDVMNAPNSQMRAELTHAVKAAAEFLGQRGNGAGDHVTHRKILF